MHWEFCIDITDQRTDSTYQRQLLHTCIQLGYTGIVYNINVSGKLNKQHINPLKPFTLDAYTLRTLGCSIDSTHIQQVYRLTYTIESANDLQQLNRIGQNSAIIQSYDIIAVQCSNEQSFVAATACDWIDIIQFDPGNRMPFYIKKSQIHTAAQRQIVFELLYGQSIIDVKARKHLIAHALSILRMSNGKNLLLSSGGTHSTQMRTPADVYNIALMLHIPQDTARRMIYNIGDRVVLHAITRQQTVKGTIQHIDK